MNHIKTHGLVECHIPKGKKTRKSRTVQFKLNCVKYCQLSLTVPFCADCEIWIRPTNGTSVATCTLCERTVNPRHRSQTNVALELGVDKQQLSKWLRKESDLSLVASERPGMKKMHMGRAVKYVDQSNELYRYVPKPVTLSTPYTHRQFLDARLNMGETVNSEWFRDEFEELLIKEIGPEHGHKLSSGWLNRLVKRHRLSSQLRTEKKEKSSAQRMLLLDHFYNDYQCLQRTLPQVDSKWGAFRPEDMWNADHIPWQFSMYFKRSYNPKNTYCWIKGS